MDWDQYYKDTQRFRNAYSDFRRTESSTLSSQYDLWDHSARRSSAALSIANVKQPQYRAVSRIGIVDTPETARLHPHRLSKLSPFVSNYTVDPTSGTTSLFMNQWHNGLGLPTRADDEAIEGFRMIKKSQFIDNQTAILESKAPELRYIKGNKILEMCKDLFSSTASETSGDLLLVKSKSIFAELSRHIAFLFPQSLRAIYEELDKITNSKQSGRLDVRLFTLLPGTQKVKRDLLTRLLQPRTNQGKSFTFPNFPETSKEKDKTINKTTTGDEPFVKAGPGSTGNIANAAEMARRRPPGVNPPRRAPQGPNPAQAAINAAQEQEDFFVADGHGGRGGAPPPTLTSSNAVTAEAAVTAVTQDRMRRSIPIDNDPNLDKVNLIKSFPANTNTVSKIMNVIESVRQCKTLVNTILSKRPKELRDKDATYELITTMSEDKVPSAPETSKTGLSDDQKITMQQYNASLAQKGVTQPTTTAPSLQNSNQVGQQMNTQINRSATQNTFSSLGAVSQATSSNQPSVYNDNYSTYSGPSDRNNSELSRSNSEAASQAEENAYEADEKQDGANDFYNQSQANDFLDNVDFNQEGQYDVGIDDDVTADIDVAQLPNFQNNEEVNFGDEAEQITANEGEAPLEAPDIPAVQNQAAQTPGATILNNVNTGSQQNATETNLPAIPNATNPPSPTGNVVPPAAVNAKTPDSSANEIVRDALKEEDLTLAIYRNNEPNSTETSGSINNFINSINSKVPSLLMDVVNSTPEAINNALSVVKQQSPQFLETIYRVVLLMSVLAGFGETVMKFFSVFTSNNYINDPIHKNAFVKAQEELKKDKTQYDKINDALDKMARQDRTFQSPLKSNVTITEMSRNASPDVEPAQRSNAANDDVDKQLNFGEEGADEKLDFGEDGEIQTEEEASPAGITSVDKIPSSGTQRVLIVPASGKEVTINEKTFYDELKEDYNDVKTAIKNYLNGDDFLLSQLKNRPNKKLGAEPDNIEGGKQSILYIKNPSDVKTQLNWLKSNGYIDKNAEPSTDMGKVIGLATIFFSRSKIARMNDATFTGTGKPAKRARSVAFVKGYESKKQKREGQKA